jgi:hypothetical protein
MVGRGLAGSNSGGVDGRGSTVDNLAEEAAGNPEGGGGRSGDMRERGSTVEKVAAEGGQVSAVENVAEDREEFDLDEEELMGEVEASQPQIFTQ